MNTLKGNLIKLALEGKFDVIIHGCNCFCTMGAGIAKTIKLEFPEAYKIDLSTIKGDRSKLGNLSFILVTRKGFSFYIINAYIQYDYKGRGVKVDYEAIRKIFQKIKESFKGYRIAYPLIGCGLAGGNWSIVSSIIDEELKDEDHTLVILP